MELMVGVAMPALVGLCKASVQLCTDLTCDRLCEATVQLCTDLTYVIDYARPLYNSVQI